MSSTDRRTFLNQAITLASAAVAAPCLNAANAQAASSAPAGAAVTPFSETRGGRSADPAVQTQAIATHVAETKYEDLDRATVRKAKHRVLDLIGCLIGGVAEPSNAALIDVVREAGGTPEASIIGHRFKTSAAQAAMVNAAVARSYDFEVMTVAVGGRYVGSHNSPTTCMTALALCERGRRSGRDFITALAVGDDFAARLLAASGLDLGLGWDGSSTYPALPAAAIAARLLGLSARQTQDAFGLTLDTIAGSNQNTWDGATDWKLSQGCAARNGIIAAQLARRGWVGVGDALRAPYGFFSLFTAGCEQPQVLTADLGKAFYSEEYFKPYPACAASHTSIECALAVRARHGLLPSRIRQVTTHLPAPSLKSPLALTFHPARYSHCSANFSIHFQVANALLHGNVRQEHYSEQAVRASSLAAMLDKVSLAALPAGQAGVEIEILTDDGGKLTERHSGTPDHYPGVNPFSYEQIVAKFRQQVAFSGFVSDRTADEIIQRVDELEHEADMAGFVQLLTHSSLA